MENQTPQVPQEQSEKDTNPPFQATTHHRWLVPLLIVIIAILAGSVYFLVKNSKKSAISINPTPVITKKIEPSPILVDTSDWKTYTDTQAGFSFNYPSSVLIKDDAKGATQMTLGVSAQKLSSIPEDLPMNGGRNEALKEKERLANNTGNDLIRIGSLNGATSMTLSQFDVCSVIFSRKLVFYPGEYQVLLTLFAPQSEITAAMPEFFQKDPPNCGEEIIWNHNKLSQFEPTLSKGLGKGIAQEWYDTFQAIAKTVSLTTPTKTVLNDSLLYKNATYGFEMTYTSPYKVLVDTDSLSGFPNGIALIYNGGQAYDIVVEVWNSKSEYEQMYASRMNEISIHEVNGKFITIANNTNEPGNQNIIDSFKFSAQ